MHEPDGSSLIEAAAMAVAVLFLVYLIVVVALDIARWVMG